MKNCLFLSLGVAVVLFSATESWARGGGGGRGGARGGARPGGFSGGSIRSGADSRSIGEGKQFNQAGNRNPGEKAGNFQNKFSNLQANSAARNQAFSPAWYANHPRAWQYTHPNANAWAIATLGGAAAWLGIAADDAGGTVYTSDEDDEDDSSATDDQQLAQQGAVDLPADEDFLPLGVFALLGENQQDATAMLQLAVSRDGILRGTYYDILTDQEQAIQGAVDKKTQRVAFTAGSNGPVMFETKLSNLTQAKGAITLQFASGQTKQWTLARYDNGPSKPE